MTDSGYSLFIACQIMLLLFSCKPASVKEESSFIIRLLYTQPNNFTGEVLYKVLKEAYLHPDAAKALLVAHEVLKRFHPDYRLIIYEAACRNYRLIP